MSPKFYFKTRFNKYNPYCGYANYNYDWTEDIPPKVTYPQKQANIPFREAINTTPKVYKEFTNTEPPHVNETTQYTGIHSLYGSQVIDPIIIPNTDLWEMLKEGSVYITMGGTTFMVIEKQDYYIWIRPHLYYTDVKLSKLYLMRAMINNNPTSELYMFYRHMGTENIGVNDIVRLYSHTDRRYQLGKVISIEHNGNLYSNYQIRKEDNFLTYKQRKEIMLVRPASKVDTEDADNMWMDLLNSWTKYKNYDA